MSAPEKNKATAQSFHDLMFNQCRPAEAINQYAGDTYIQHSPHVGDGKIVEHWDVLQVISPISKNDNTMFLTLTPRAPHRSHIPTTPPTQVGRTPADRIDRRDEQRRFGTRLLHQ
ncbi:hypothetical protein ABZ835_32585 [Streptomyces sp. NPDC047461]|uniref:nuclear transport factor 2 family protein n=1 Tax=Streptomyces sp. NPDC047461 TaxID=3155619 RepID=UPI00340FEAE1